MFRVRRPYRPGFTLVELLVVIAICGVLMAMLLPAASQVKAAANRFACANNLKQMGIALHAYHEAYGCFPPSRINPATMVLSPNVGVADLQDYYGTAAYRGYNHSGFVLLLPYLEQDQIYKKYDFAKRGCSARNNPFPEAAMAPPSTENDEVLSTYVKAYLCPADLSDGALDSDSHALRGGYSNAARSNYAFCIFAADWELATVHPLVAMG